MLQLRPAHPQICPTIRARGLENRRFHLICVGESPRVVYFARVCVARTTTLAELTKRKQKNIT